MPISWRPTSIGGLRSARGPASPSARLSTWFAFRAASSARSRSPSSARLSPSITSLSGCPTSRAKPPPPAPRPDVTQVPDAATRWKDALASWAIPDWILAQAREDPWALPVTLVEHKRPDNVSPSHRRDPDSLAPDPPCLELGAGRGATALRLRPAAVRVGGGGRAA